MLINILRILFEKLKDFFIDIYKIMLLIIFFMIFIINIFFNLFNQYSTYAD